MTPADHPDNDNASHDLEKGGHEERVDQSRSMSTVQILWPRHISRRLKNPTQDVKVDSSRKRQHHASANPEDVEASDRRFVAKKKGIHHAMPLQVYLSIWTTELDGRGARGRSRRRRRLQRVR
jgi:hypothetical protein